MYYDDYVPVATPPKFILIYCSQKAEEGTWTGCGCYYLLPEDAKQCPNGHAIVK
jgi:hypothetical protein